MTQHTANNNEGELNAWWKASFDKTMTVQTVEVLIGNTNIAATNMKNAAIMIGGQECNRFTDGDPPHKGEWATF